MIIPAIELDSVTKFEDDRRIVDNVSLNIMDGEFLSLLGPGRSGKTTILLLAAGIEKPSFGEVHPRGQAIPLGPPRVRDKRIEAGGFGFALFPHLTVLQNVSLLLRARGIDVETTEGRARRALETVGLKGLENTHPSHLSDRQRRLVRLASAMAFQPDILLLDEPFEDMDPVVRKAMQQVIRRIHDQEKLTIVYATRNHADALTFSDRLAVVDHGQVVQVGTPSEIREFPKSTFMAEFISSVAPRQTWESGFESELNLADYQRQQLDSTIEVPEDPRYLNVSIVREEEHRIVEQKTNLAAATDYSLRIDIGSLSPESIVEKAEKHPFPSKALPKSERGHWLEVIAVSDEFSIPRRRHNLFLGELGASWKCDCLPGGLHFCTEKSRQTFLLIPIRTPASPGTARMRLCIYYKKNLIQSMLITAEISTSEKYGYGQTARMDYTLSAQLRSISQLPPRAVNILTNENSDGSDKIVINGPNADLDFNISEGQQSNSINPARRALRQAHYREWRKPLSRKLERRNLFDIENKKSKEEFVDDLKNLARLGSRLWSVLLSGHEDWWEVFQDPIIIQVSRTVDSRFVFPWALVYDISMQPGERVERILCRLLTDWETWKYKLAEDNLRRCPFAEDYHKPNTICPFGFWGYRHYIEQPPSVPDDYDVPLVIKVVNRPPSLAVGLSHKLEKDLTNVHFSKVSRLQFGVEEYASRDELGEALGRHVELVYFYCHGKWKTLPGGTERIPYLEIGAGDTIEPEDIVFWRRELWPTKHWKDISPLVFINGCHTVEITPELLLSFVDKFAEAYAGGIIGTEISIAQPVASEAGEEFLSGFQDRKPVGEALHQMRIRLLSKNNVLGLAYTPYCSADLKLSD